MEGAVRQHQPDLWPGQIVTYTRTTAVHVTNNGDVNVVKYGETLSGIFGANGWQ
jgi:hypothetical protein